MLKFYFNGSPNPTKVALFLEEAGVAYQPVPVDTRVGDQFAPEYLAVNPNSKVPAIDDDGVKVFDSNAILLYLAEKTGKFLPPISPANRAELLSWLMFVATGVGPFSGQAVHFKHFSPEKVDYAHNRYQFEAQRHYAILNDRLAKRRYMVGDTYTIVDMDVWGWARMIPFVLGEGAFANYPNVKRLGQRQSRPRSKPDCRRVAADRLRTHGRGQCRGRRGGNHIRDPRLGSVSGRGGTRVHPAADDRQPARRA
jgi:GSH-dependent disulfide-bond oxidoreductase